MPARAIQLVLGIACLAILPVDMLRAEETNAAVFVPAQPSSAVTVTATAAAPAAAADEQTPTRVLVQRLHTNDLEALIATIDEIGLQDSGSSYVLEEFARLLEHPSNDVKQAVLDAVFGFDSVRALLPALEKCLGNEDESIREDAADVLGEIETRDMIDVFVRHIDSPHEDVRDNAEFYLLFWTDENFTNLNDWVTWWASNKETFVFE